MKIDAMTIKEKNLTGVWEKLREMVGILEDYVPDVAEELNWISENLYQEILSLGREKRARLAPAGDEA